MNIKRGFTLIELLAVIVILAIIAIIATPIVLNIIEDTKINSVKSSASMYLKAVKLYILNEELNEIEISPGTYPITEDGDICIGIIENNICNGEKIKIEVKGSKPNSGKVKITENSIQIDYLEINGYVYYKEKDKYIIKKGKEEFKESNNSVITLDSSKIPYLTNYRIYGNSYQGVGSGKNLFNINLYSIDSEGNIMISAENLRIGETYTISSEKPFIRLKISNRSTGYNSVHKLDYSGMTTFTFTMDRNENISETETQYIFISFDFSDATFSKSINELKKAKIQIEEGTEATEYEPYGLTPSLEVPSEIKSVGDLVTEEGPKKGKYEIPIKVTGKNLLDVNDFIQTYEIYFHASEKKPIITEFNGETVLQLYGGVDVAGRAIKYMNGYFEKNIQYTFSMDFYDIPENNIIGPRLYFVYEDSTSELLLPSSRTPYNEWKKNVITSEENKSINYIRQTYNSSSAKSYIKNFQIEPGTKATSYEPYKENRYSIYLDEPLRCIEDICDYIDYNSSKVIRYIEQINYDGTKLIEESFVVLSEPIIENVELPKININEGVNNIFIETNVKPSKFNVNYYK